jgi:ATP-dependent DNA helicase DinG
MAVVRINIPSKAGLPDEWDNIRPHFPMPSPRRFQAEALSVVWWALKHDDFDNIVVQAPTGIGKSAIAMTLQTQFQSAYLLTPSLGLAEQYKRDYGHALAEVRGRSNFPCWVRSGDAKDAPCYTKSGSCRHAKREEDGGEPCPYYEQRFAAEDARLTLSNPAYLFRAVRGFTNFDQRDFAIIDEAHDMEGFLSDLLEVRFSEKEWGLLFGRDPFPSHLSPKDWREEMKERREQTKAIMARADDEKAVGRINEKEYGRIREAVSKVETAFDILLKPSNVHVSFDRNRFGTFLCLKPIRVRDYAADMLEQVSRKRVFLSATILDVDTFLHGLGLEDQRTLYVNITESPFPRDHFNVHYVPCGSMSWGKRKATIPKQVKAIDAIMQHFPHKRGVILPHSHAIRKELVDGLIAAGHEDRIITHDSNARAREVALESFFKSERDDLVLISTYVTQGFDFKGKLAEWLVICKVPYLPTNDPVIGERLLQDEQAWRSVHEGTPSCPYEPPSRYSGDLCGAGFTCEAPCKRWYNLQTALAIVQGAGRVVRTPEDVGHLFILDGGWARFARSNAALLPSWFRDNVKDEPRWLKRMR